MKQLLTLKHWQLVGLLIGPILLSQFFILSQLLARNSLKNLLAYSSVIMLLVMGLFFSWLYAAGNNLQRKLPATVSMNLTRFNVAITLPAMYIAAVTLGSSVLSQQVAPLINYLSGLQFLAIMLPLHLLSMACIFYCLYFNAKALKTVELQRKIKFEEFMGEFFLIWFFPVGIWIIQPRLNRLFYPTAASA